MEQSRRLEIFPRWIRQMRQQYHDSRASSSSEPNAYPQSGVPRRQPLPSISHSTHRPRTARRPSLAHHSTTPSAPGLSFRAPTTPRATAESKPPRSSAVGTTTRPALSRDGAERGALLRRGGAAGGREQEHGVVHVPGRLDHLHPPALLRLAPRPLRLRMLPGGCLDRRQPRALRRESPHSLSRPRPLALSTGVCLRAVARAIDF